MIPNRIVLRGAGKALTTILFPAPLSKAYDAATPRPDGSTAYTNGGGFITFEGLEAWRESRYMLGSVAKVCS